MENYPKKTKKVTNKKAVKPKSSLRRQPPLKVTKVNVLAPTKKVPAEPKTEKKTVVNQPKAKKKEVKQPETKKENLAKPVKNADELANEAILKCGVKKNTWTKAALQKYNKLYVPNGYRAGNMGDLGFVGWAPLMKRVMLCEKHKVPSVVPINEMGVSFCPFCGY